MLVSSNNSSVIIDLTLHKTKVQKAGVLGIIIFENFKFLEGCFYDCNIEWDFLKQKTGLPQKKIADNGNVDCWKATPELGFDSFLPYPLQSYGSITGVFSFGIYSMLARLTIW